MSNVINTTPEESTFNFGHDECWICGTKLTEGSVVFDHTVRFEGKIPESSPSDIIDRRCLRCEYVTPTVLDKEYLVKMGFAKPEEVENLGPHRRILNFSECELDNRDENATWINVDYAKLQIRMTREDLERLIQCFDQSRDQTPATDDVVESQRYGNYSDL
jgi:hypothetical protein